MEPTWPKNKKPFDYQIEGAKFILSRQNTYLCDEPGLGKTIQAIISINSIAKKRPIIVVCPPFLALNWQKELNEWTTKPLSIYIAKKTSEIINFKKDIIIIPDSLIISDKIINQFYNYNFDFLIIDEAHRFKNGSAKRTQSIESIAKKCERIIALSGTPMPNRPIELFTMTKLLCWSAINNLTKHKYGLRYCGGHHDGFGWNYTGATKMKELSEKLKSNFMIRRKKKEVLKELPDKVIQILEIQPNSKEQVYLNREQNEVKAELKKAELEMSQFLAGSHSQNIMGQISEVRKELAFLKTNRIKELIDDILENPKQKLLIFGYHNEPLKELAKICGEYAPMLIQGDTPKDKRDFIVELFQKDPDKRLIIGNYQACGVGLTLTAADRVLFLEPSWVPAENEQAIDRTHRIGQKNSVLAQFVVYRGSLDEMILKSNFNKTNVIDKIINN